jgi:acyl-CoA thioesterase
MARRVPLPTPDKTRTWAEQMALEQIGERTFRSLSGTPYGTTTEKNGELRPRAYGGHVYAQAVYAASKTVAKGLMIHVCEQRLSIFGSR